MLELLTEHLHVTQFDFGVIAGWGWAFYINTVFSKSDEENGATARFCLNWLEWYSFELDVPASAILLIDVSKENFKLFFFLYSWDKLNKLAADRSLTWDPNEAERMKHFFLCWSTKTIMTLHHGFQKNIKIQKFACNLIDILHNVQVWMLNVEVMS